MSQVAPVRGVLSMSSNGDSASAAASSDRPLRSLPRSTSRMRAESVGANGASAPMLTYYPLTPDASDAVDEALMLSFQRRIGRILASMSLHGKAQPQQTSQPLVSGPAGSPDSLFGASPAADSAANPVSVLPAQLLLDCHRLRGTALRLVQLGLDVDKAATQHLQRRSAMILDVEQRRTAFQHIEAFPSLTKLLLLRLQVESQLKAESRRNTADFNQRQAHNLSASAASPGDASVAVGGPISSIAIRSAAKSSLPRNFSEGNLAAGAGLNRVGIHDAATSSGSGDAGMQRRLDRKQRGTGGGSGPSSTLSTSSLLDTYNNNLYESSSNSTQGRKNLSLLPLTYVVDSVTEERIKLRLHLKQVQPEERDAAGDRAEQRTLKQRLLDTASKKSTNSSASTLIVNAYPSFSRLSRPRSRSSSPFPTRSAATSPSASPLRGSARSPSPTPPHSPLLLHPPRPSSAAPTVSGYGSHMSPIEINSPAVSISLAPQSPIIQRLASSHAPPQLPPFPSASVYRPADVDAARSSSFSAYLRFVMEGTPPMAPNSPKQISARQSEASVEGEKRKGDMQSRTDGDEGVQEEEGSAEGAAQERALEGKSEQEEPKGAEVRNNELNRSQELNAKQNRKAAVPSSLPKRKRRREEQQEGRDETASTLDRELHEVTQNGSAKTEEHRTKEGEAGAEEKSEEHAQRRGRSSIASSSTASHSLSPVLQPLPISHRRSMREFLTIPSSEGGTLIIPAHSLNRHQQHQQSPTTPLHSDDENHSHVQGKEEEARKKKKRSWRGWALVPESDPLSSSSTAPLPLPASTSGLAPAAAAATTPSASTVVDAMNVYDGSLTVSLLSPASATSTPSALNGPPCCVFSCGVLDRCSFDLADSACDCRLAGKQCAAGCKAQLCSNLSDEAKKERDNDGKRRKRKATTPVAPTAIHSKDGHTAAAMLVQPQQQPRPQPQASRSPFAFVSPFPSPSSSPPSSSLPDPPLSSSPNLSDTSSTIDPRNVSTPFSASPSPLESLAISTAYMLSHQNRNKGSKQLVAQGTLQDNGRSMKNKKDIQLGIPAQQQQPQRNKQAHSAHSQPTVAFLSTLQQLTEGDEEKEDGQEQKARTEQRRRKSGRAARLKGESAGQNGHVDEGMSAGAEGPAEQELQAVYDEDEEKNVRRNERKKGAEQRRLERVAAKKAKREYRNERRRLAWFKEKAERKAERERRAAEAAVNHADGGRDKNQQRESSLPQSSVIDEDGLAAAGAGNGGSVTEVGPQKSVALAMRRLQTWQPVVVEPGKSRTAKLHEKKQKSAASAEPNTEELLRELPGETKRMASGDASTDVKHEAGEEETAGEEFGDAGDGALRRSSRRKEAEQRKKESQKRAKAVKKNLKEEKQQRKKEMKMEMMKKLKKMMKRQLEKKLRRQWMHKEGSTLDEVEERSAEGSMLSASDSDSDDEEWELGFGSDSPSDADSDSGSSLSSSSSSESDSDSSSTSRSSNSKSLDSSSVFSSSTAPSVRPSLSLLSLAALEREAASGEHMEYERMLSAPGSSRHESPEESSLRMMATPAAVLAAAPDSSAPSASTLSVQQLLQKLHSDRTEKNGQEGQMARRAVAAAQRRQTLEERARKRAQMRAQETIDPDKAWQRERWRQRKEVSRAKAIHAAIDKAKLSKSHSHYTIAQAVPAVVLPPPTNSAQHAASTQSTVTHADNTHTTVRTHSTSSVLPYHYASSSFPTHARSPSASSYPHPHLHPSHPRSPSPSPSPSHAPFLPHLASSSSSSSSFFSSSPASASSSPYPINNMLPSPGPRPVPGVNDSYISAQMAVMRATADIQAQIRQAQSLFAHDQSSNDTAYGGYRHAVPHVVYNPPGHVHSGANSNSSGISSYSHSKNHSSLNSSNAPQAQSAASPPAGPSAQAGGRQVQHSHAAH